MSATELPAQAARPGADWRELLEGLFGGAHDVRCESDFLRGTAEFEGQRVAIVGSAHHAEVGVELALAQARAVLDTVRDHPGRPLLLLVDTQGQRLRRRDELLHIARYMAHLGKALALARKQGHPIVGLVYDQALSGGFITSGLMADDCHALAHAEIRVMRLPAMARVTKIDEARLAELAQDNPVFAPGVRNYLAMGGVKSLWQGDPASLRAALRSALAERSTSDVRADDGAARGGRRLAATIAREVHEQGMKACRSVATT